VAESNRTLVFEDPTTCWPAASLRRSRTWLARFGATSGITTNGRNRFDGDTTTRLIELVVLQRVRCTSSNRARDPLLEQHRRVSSTRAVRGDRGRPVSHGMAPQVYDVTISSAYDLMRRPIEVVELPKRTRAWAVDGRSKSSQGDDQNSHNYVLIFKPANRWKDASIFLVFVFFMSLFD